MSLEQPGWLVLLLLLPLLATGAALVSHSRARQWSAFVADRLRTRLLRRSSPVPRWIAFTCLLLAVALLVIGLARPLSRKGSEREEVLGRNILFALDLSRSMKTRDLSPDRLSQAKTVCFDLLESMPTDRVGVVGFAGTAYLFAPLTVDHANVRETIGQLDIDWIPTGGSDLEAGLRLSIETLKETGTRPNALILLSDGEQNEGDIAELAADARDAGIEVIAIGFGTQDGDLVPDPANPELPFRDRGGNEVLSRLEPRPLQRLATVTGGRFAIARSGADIPHMVQTAISDLEQVRITGTQHTITVEYFQWFVLPAILLLIASVTAATRWRGVGAVPVTLALGLASTDLARGGPVDDARAALADQRYEDAVEAFSALAEKHRDSEEGYRFSLAAGEAAYRQQDWPAARKGFSEAMRSEDSAVRHAAHHGLGNLLFQTGWERLSGGPSYPETVDESAADSPDDPGLEAFRRLFDALLGRDGEQEEPEAGEDPMAGFEEMVRQRLTEWMTDSSESDSPARGADRFNGVLTDWIDAVRHFDAAPGVPGAAANRELTVKHLRKLREILEELQETAEALQAMPQSPGEGQPQQQGEPGEGQQGEPREQEGGEGGEDPQQQGEGDEPQEDEEGPGDSEDEDEPGQDGDEPPEDEGEDEGSTEPQPDESPEEAARRILGENSDLQKGALSPGRIRYRQRPDKDW